MSEDKIAKALGLEPVKPKNKWGKPIIDMEETSYGELVPSDPHQEEQGKDFGSVQEQIRKIAQLGSEKLNELSELATASQHPRAYEVFTELMKAAVSAQKDLLEIQKTQLELEQKKANGGREDENQGKVINNQLFVGSTAEMANMMRQLQNNKNDTGPEQEKKKLDASED